MRRAGLVLCVTYGLSESTDSAPDKEIPLNKFILGAIGATSCLALVISLAPSAVAGNAKAQPPAATTVTANGPMTCVDCEVPNAVSVTLCHSASLTLTLGSSQLGSFATGQSSSACVTVPAVGPDHCVWFEYHYSCTYGGFFGSWSCTSLGANVKVGDNPFC